jgi:membrane protein required for colicin V production
MHALTAMDIVVILLIGAGALFGFLRGFVTELLSLIAWVAAIMALKLFYTPASALAGKFVSNPAAAAVLAFALLFLVTFFAFKWVAASMGARTRQSIVGPVDRLLGGGFGAAKGLIGACLLFLGANLFYDMGWGRDSVRPPWMTASRTYPLLKLASKVVVDFVEERRHQLLDPANSTST